MKERLGFQFLLLLVWLVFDFGRPESPLKIPMLISFVLLGGWLLRANKQWTTQTWCFLVLLVQMAVSVPFAVNTYTAFWTTYSMAVLFLCICLPLPSLVTSLLRIRLWAYTFLAVAWYVGVFAMAHDGRGPNTDENYVAALMGTAIPFAYFSLFVERRPVARIMLLASIVVLVGATVASFSRGGFVGLVAVVLYCLALSPKKLRGFAVVTVIGLAVLLFAGPTYWEEMQTIRDVDQGTADLRIEFWKIGVRVWQANPLVGVGPGNFMWVMVAYQSDEQTAKFDRGLMAAAHSVYVELLTEFGIAGVLVVGVLLWRTWVNLRQVHRSASARSGGPPVARDQIGLRCYADAVGGALVAVLVNGLFVSLLYYSHLWLLIALGSAVAQASRSRAGEQGTP